MGVYEHPGGGWLKDKQYGDQVTGPNSDVMSNLSVGWRAVYT
ncbi:hypothetical protein [Parafrankia sp. EUN1f]|nr:hypothetical protein [Parafrankia sp. EUN1f]